MNPLIKWSAALIGAVLALISNFALAGDFNPANGTAWDLYVFGNGEAVAAILSSVGAMVSSSGYKHLLWFIGVMAMFGWGIFIGMSAQNLAKFSPYFVTMIIILYTLVGFPGLGGSSGLRANINVIDRNDLTYTKIVSTSALVGVSAAIISQVGNWLTTAMEQNFSTPGQLKMSGGSSFMMGQRLINDAGQMHIQNTDLRQSIANYTEDCAIPLMASGDIDPGKLTLSKNLWADLKSTNQGLMTRVKPMGEPTGVFTNCSDAYNRIGEDLVRYVPDLIRANGAAWATTPAFGYTASVMDSAMAYFGGDNSVGAGGAAIKQSAMINTFQRSFGQAAASANNNEMMMAIQTSSAEKSQKAGWIIGASLFNNMMGYVYAILQAFIIGIGPIMAAAILIPGFGFIIVKNYLQILLWTIMWDPLLAVIQFIMAVYGQQDLNALLSVSSGISISNLPALTEKTNNMLIAGGFFATMVPLLAWGLVKGSMAFTEFISHGMGSNLASSAGANAANGNLNMDNISMGNIAMHKQSMDYSASVGMQPTMAHTSGASLTSAFNAGGYTSGSAAGQATVTSSASAGKNSSAAQQYSRDLTASIQKSDKTAKQESAQFGKDYATSAGWGSGGDSTRAQDHGKGLTRDQAEAEASKALVQVGKSTDYSSEAAWKEALALRAGAAVGGSVDTELGKPADNKANPGTPPKDTKAPIKVKGMVDLGGGITDVNENGVRAGKKESEGTTSSVDTSQNNANKLSTVDNVKSGSKASDHAKRDRTAKETSAFNTAMSHASEYVKSVQASQKASETLQRGFTGNTGQVTSVPQGVSADGLRQLSTGGDGVVANAGTAAREAELAMNSANPVVDNAMTALNGSGTGEPLATFNGKDVNSGAAAIEAQRLAVRAGVVVNSDVTTKVADARINAADATFDNKNTSMPVTPGAPPPTDRAAAIRLEAARLKEKHDDLVSRDAPLTPKGTSRVLTEIHNLIEKPFK